MTETVREDWEQKFVDDARDWAVLRAKLEIAEDMGNGIVPSTVKSYSELHDHVDANEYGGACEVDPPDEDSGLGRDFYDLHVEAIIAMQDVVDAWIKAGDAKPVEEYRFRVHFKTVGNPDFQQYAPISDPMTVYADTVEEIDEYRSAYFATYEVGSGNWTSPPVYEQTTKRGKRVGSLQYSGQIHATEWVYGGPDPVVYRG